MVESMRPCVQLRVLRRDGGKFAALNAAVRASTGVTCLFLDDAVVASPRLVAEHIAAHQTNQRLIGIGALIQGPIPGSRDWFAQASAATWKEHYDVLSERAANWMDCYSANLSAPRSALLEAGGFSTDLPCGQDIERGYRLGCAGCTPRYLPRAEGIHDDRERGGQIIQARRRLGTSLPVLLDMHPGMASRLVGWFREPTLRDVTLRRILLAIRTPPKALTLLGRLIPGQQRRTTWFGFISRYAVWYGARTSMNRERWKNAIRGVPVLMYHAFTKSGIVTAISSAGEPSPAKCGCSPRSATALSRLRTLQNCCELANRFLNDP